MNTIGQFIAEISRVQSEGGNISALLAQMQALEANRQTSLGLNQWLPQDKPSMEDFNRDNEIIDREIVALYDEKADKAAVYSKTEVDEKVGVKADKLKPQPMALALVDGFIKVNAAEYWKTQDGITFITFRVGKNGIEIPAGRHNIAIMPNDACPHEVVHGVGYSISPLGHKHDIQIVIHSTGHIFIDSSVTLPAGAGTSFAGTISYVSK